MPPTVTANSAAAPVALETALAKLDVRAGFNTSEAFDLIQRGGTLLSKSTLVPKEYQGNLPNCVIALNMAQRIGADPLMVMQNLYIVHGRPGWSAQFLIATFNQCGRFSAIRYQWEGEPGKDTWGCRAGAVELATGERLTGALITLALAKAEGWTDKAGSKWKTMPEQMLMYRSAAWLVRAYAPEIAMGLHTVEEIADTIEMTGDAAGGYRAAPVVVTPDSLTGAVVTGENMATPGEPADPRAGLLSSISDERKALGLSDTAFNAIAKEHAHTTLIDVADPAALDALLTALKALPRK